jgi:WXG100 family type VII secretion target
MTVIGGEIAQLHTLATNLDRQSGAVDALLRELRTDLNDTFWRGGAADRFRGAWDSEYEPALNQLSAALHEAAVEVRGRADRLEEAGS